MRIALLTTGGTIAMRASDKGGQLGAPPPFIDMLARTLPEVQVTLIPVLSRPSAGFSIADIAAIAKAAETAAAAHDGVVITHGTDVLEETGFALELLIRTDTPIVLTGAMRLANQPSADGDANLIAACRVAGSGGARGKGVLVVFDDEIHWAPLAKKRHAFRTHAFSSEPFGPLGWVAEGRVRFTLRPEKSLPHLVWGGRETMVPILEAGPGLEPALVKSFRTCDALVLALPGAGHVADTVPAILEAMPMPVVFASRTGAGETLTHSYGYAGGEIDLIQRGLIPAGPLDARRARIALAILLSNGAAKPDIVAFFGSL